MSLMASRIFFTVLGTLTFVFSIGSLSYFIYMNRVNLKIFKNCLKDEEIAFLLCACLSVIIVSLVILIALYIVFLRDIWS